MEENTKIPKKEHLEKANEIISDANRKLMTEFIQYLSAKSFYINPDETLNSKFPYDPNEIAEPHHGDFNTRWKKNWVACEDMTLLTNWSNYLSDQPAKFKRLSFLLLKKPATYNILNDTLHYSKDANNDNSHSTLCGTIKLKQLIIEYIRMSKLYPRLGKGINRFLSSCYLRVQSLLTGTSNPITTGPFTESESQLCFQLYHSLQPSLSLEYVYEQIGKRLNRPKELISLFIDTIEQIQGNSQLITSSTILHREISRSEQTPPKLPKTKPKSCVPPMPLSTTPRAIASSLQASPALVPARLDQTGPPTRAELIRNIEDLRWPPQVEEVFIRALKFDFEQRLGLDLEALSHRVSTKSLRTLLTQVDIQWAVILRIIAKSCTSFAIEHLDACAEACKTYWNETLRRKFVGNLTERKRDSATPDMSKPEMVYVYDRSLLEAFLASLLTHVTARANDDVTADASDDVTNDVPTKPKKNLRVRARLLTVLKDYCSQPKPCLNWEAVASLYNADSDYPNLTPEQLRKKFVQMRYIYVPNYQRFNYLQVVKSLRRNYLPILRRKLIHHDSLHQIEAAATITTTTTNNNVSQPKKRGGPKTKKINKKGTKTNLALTKKVKFKNKNRVHENSNAEIVPGSLVDDGCTTFNVAIASTRNIDDVSPGVVVGITTPTTSNACNPTPLEAETILDPHPPELVKPEVKKSRLGEKVKAAKTADPLIDEKNVTIHRARSDEESIKVKKHKIKNSLTHQKVAEQGGVIGGSGSPPAKKSPKRKAEMKLLPSLKEDAIKVEDEEESVQIIAITSASQKKAKNFVVITLEDDDDESGGSNAVVVPSSKEPDNIEDIKFKKLIASIGYGRNEEYKVLKEIRRMATPLLPSNCPDPNKVNV